MTRLAILAAVLLAGCVASPEDSTAGHDAPDIWQTGRTCPDGRLSEPMGYTRRLVADNCGESLWLADYRVIWGCLRVWAPMDAIPL